MNYQYKCKFCRDKGRINGCPKCGKQLSLGLDVVTESPIEELTNLEIPKHYLNNKWDKNILLEDKEDYLEDADFLRYVSQLTSLYEHLANGGTINNSALICSPIGFGKTTWVYNCMIELIRHGMTVSPLISTSKIQAMQTLSYERPTWKNVYLGQSYNDIISSDVLFLAVTKSTEYVYAARTILNIVDERSQMSKPTIIVSDWSIQTLLKTETTGMLLALLRGGRNVDPMKYLVKIDFYDYKK